MSTKVQTPKQILVEKIAKEQDLNPKKLERLNMEELQKMDKVVPDTDGDLLGGDSSEEVSGELPKPADPIPADTQGTGGEISPAGGLPEDGSDDSGNGSVDAPIGNGSELGLPELGLPTSEGTTVVAAGPDSMDPEISETPKSPAEVETSEGQGDDSGSIPSGTSADHVVIGYHPATGEPVYADEQ